MTKPSIEAARTFVKSAVAEIKSRNTPKTRAATTARAAKRTRGEIKISTVDVDDLPDTVVTGGNLIEFKGDVSLEARSAVALSLLLAQRYAGTEPNSTTIDQWAALHSSALSKLGWFTAGGVFVDKELEGKNLSVHEAIIPFLTAAFGGAGVAPLILNALDQLNKVGNSAPWITLFNREAKRFDISEFHFSAAESKGGKTTVTLIAARFEGKFGDTQVLFFRLKKKKLKFKSATLTLVAENAYLEELQPDLVAKLKTMAKDFITSVR
jgi:hypothetical protein